MSALADPIEALRPWGTPEEKALRRRLHTIVVLGAARATTAASDRARTIYWEASGIALDWVMARATEQQLKNVADSVLRLFQVASTLETLEDDSDG